jgi:hypothetical protein
LAALIDVAQGDDGYALDAGDFADVARASTAGADDGDVDTVVRALLPGWGGVAGADPEADAGGRTGGGAGLEEIAAVTALTHGRVSWGDE